MPTYKVTSPDAVQAHKDFDAARDRLREAGRAFAARYPGSKPVFMTSVNDIRLHGIAFRAGNDSPLWTHPQRDAGSSQRPRLAPAKGVKGEERRQQVEQLKVLNAEWNAHFPADKASSDPVLVALGTDWGSALLSGINHFEHEGVVYVTTGIAPREGWQEILNSEYEAAMTAHTAARLAVAA